jgi:hypothetical protein
MRIFELEQAKSADTSLGKLSGVGIENREIDRVIGRTSRTADFGGLTLAYLGLCMHL